MARVHDEHGDDRAAAAGDDRAGEAVLAAWRGLPSESRALLWRLVVHEDGAVRSTPAAGTTLNGAAGRGERARARLRLGLLSELVARADTPECAAARRRLGSHLRGSSWQPGRRDVDGHLEECPRCRTAVEVLADVDGAIRQRVAPALLPGAFTTEPHPGDAVPAAADPRNAVEAPGPGALGRLDVPEHHGHAEALDRLDLLHRLAGEVAGDAAGAESWAARVLSFPGRPVSLVTAAASLALAATLYALGSVPGGAVTVDAPAAQGPPVSARIGPAEPSADPAAPAAAGRQQAIGVAVAEPASGPRDVGTEPSGDARPGTTAGRRDVGGAATAAGGSATALAPHSTRVGHAPIAAPGPASQPAGPAPAASAPVAPPTQPAPPSRVGPLTTLTFSPAGHGTFLARLAVSPGWLVTSVVDERGGRVVEHIATATTHVEERLRGHVVVEVTRVTRSAHVAAGALMVSFVGRSGSVLPGSGTYGVR